MDWKRITASMEWIEKAKQNLQGRYNSFHGINYSEWTEDDSNMLAYLDQIEYNLQHLLDHRGMGEGAAKGEAHLD